jgi:hypothetical protein
MDPSVSRVARNPSRMSPCPPNVAWMRTNRKSGSLACSPTPPATPYPSSSGCAKTQARVRSRGTTQTYRLVAAPGPNLPYWESSRGGESHPSDQKLPPDNEIAERVTSGGAAGCLAGPRAGAGPQARVTRRAPDADHGERRTVGRQWWNLQGRLRPPADAGAYLGMPDADFEVDVWARKRLLTL